MSMPLRHALCALGAFACGQPVPKGRADTAAPPPEAPESVAPDAPDLDTWSPPLAGVEMSWLSPPLDEPQDECVESCVSVDIRSAGHPLSELTVTFEMENYGFLGMAETDAAGTATLCITGLPAGVQNVAATTRFEGEEVQLIRPVEVRPFGLSFGISKPLDPLRAVPWVPTLERHPNNPVLGSDGPDSWDAMGAIMPTVVKTDAGYFMYYAGTSTADYSIGVATSEDGLSWTKYLDNPIFGPGGEAHPWRRYAVNSPMALHVDGRIQLWFSGRQEETGNIGIGLAESLDGLTFSEVSANPVFAADPANADWEGEAVAHPSVLLRDGVYEMWYSTGLHRIGYAISTNGSDWTRYCGGPVLSGDQADWENGVVKAAEVTMVDDTYLMTFSAGEPGAFRVGWAASNDGIRWVTSGSPILTEQEGSEWEDLSVVGAAWRMEDDVLTTWYSGTAARGTSVGVATATWSER
jgi:predicted GH43/DUF377 family glycosyl hydrolase